MRANPQIMIRMLTDEDLGAIRRLAQRDSTQAPSLPLLGAIQDDRLIAALGVGHGAAAIADPFSATAEAVGLLRLRAAQLRGEAGKGGRRRLRLPRRRRRARGAIAGSPPGAAGQLLRL